MRNMLERISRRQKGRGANDGKVCGSFGLFYEEVGKLPRIRK